METKKGVMIAGVAAAFILAGCTSQGTLAGMDSGKAKCKAMVKNHSCKGKAATSKANTKASCKSKCS